MNNQEIGSGLPSGILEEVGREVFSINERAY